MVSRINFLKKEEGKRKKEEGRRKKEERRKKKEEGERERKKEKKGLKGEGFFVTLLFGDDIFNN
ncbi:MAG: hypothetical protein F6K48_06335 [Okeania sp. SIO3H1]|nr:hypothetical protein [Okeania sp. SIO3H1]